MPAYCQTIPYNKPVLKNLHIPNAKVFCLRQFFTKEECQYYVQQSEKIGYQSLQHEYPLEYRNSERCLVRSKQVSDAIWKRLALLCEKEFANVKPFGIGNDGRWLPTSLNEVIKFTKYTPGGRFLPHIDNSIAKSNNEKSIFTIIIYLNQDFEGGETRFFERKLDTELPFTASIDTVTVLESFAPEAGTCLVFNHDVLHDGAELLSGTKYIIRAEIIFQRRPDNGSVLNSPVLNRQFLEASVLYMTSEQLEQRGLLFESTKKYLKALAIQANFAPSVGTLSKSSFERDIPFEVLVHVLEFINDYKALVASSMINRRWNYACMESSLWKPLYMVKYSALPEHISCTNWFYNFRDRARAEKKIGTPVLCIGNTKLMLGYGGCLQPWNEEPSVLFTIGCSHGYDCADMAVGNAAILFYKEARPFMMYTSYFAEPYIRRAICYLLQYMNVEKSQNILLVMEYFSEFATDYRIPPNFRLVHAADAAMIGSGMESGILVHVGSFITSIRVYNKKLLVDHIRFATGGYELLTSIMPYGLKSSEWLNYSQVKQKYCSMPAKNVVVDESCKKVTYSYKESKSFSDYDIFTCMNKHMGIVMDHFVKLVKKNSKVAKYFSNIVLSGGHTKIRGYAERLQAELNDAFPTYDAQVIAHPQRDEFKWLGASKIATNIHAYKAYFKLPHELFVEDE